MEHPDGSIYFPHDRQQLSYHPIPEAPGFYAADLTDLDSNIVAPCALCGHLRTERESIDGPNEEWICFACALAVADNLAQFLNVPKLFEAPRTVKNPNRKVFGAVLKAQVFKRDQHACRYCGSRNDLSLDHLFPVVRGGENTIENLVVACDSCNSKKGARTPEEAGMSLLPLGGEHA